MIKGMIIAILMAGCLSAKTIHLTTENTITLRGEVNESSVSQVQLELSKKSNARVLPSLSPLFLVIDSPGGSIVDGLALIEFAKTIPNLHTLTLFGASMASGIQQALPGNRYVTNTSVIMFHRAKGGFNGQFGEGEVESQLNMAKDLVSILDNANASRMKMNVETYRSLAKDEYWIVGKNIMGKNGADELVNVTCSPALIEASTVQTFQVFIFRMSMKFSNCPLIRSGEVVKGDEHYTKYKAYFDKKMTGPYSMTMGASK